MYEINIATQTGMHSVCFRSIYLL